MVNVFVSYSHADEKIVETFLKKSFPLHSGKTQICNIWRDRMMTSGDNMKVSIFEKIKETDIAILFISVDFLSSQSCQEELEQFYGLHEERGLKILSFIVNRCLWKEDIRLSNNLALTKDGQPYDSYSKSHKDDYWEEVITNFKSAINKYQSEHPEIIRESTITKKAQMYVEFDKNTDIDLFIEDLNTLIRNKHRELSERHFNGSVNDKVVYEFQGTYEEIYNILNYIRLQDGEKFISNITFKSDSDKLERDDLTIDDVLAYLND